MSATVRTKTLIASILAGVTTLASAFLNAPTAMATGGQCFDYTSSGTEITITAKGFCSGALEIPAVVAGLPVTTIARRAFAGASLTSVVIPASVTTVNAGAFSNNTALTVASFLGAPPSVSGSAFGGTSPFFHIDISQSGHMAPSDPTGFTLPTWNGYSTAGAPAIEIDGVIYKSDFNGSATVIGHTDALVSHLQIQSSVTILDQVLPVTLIDSWALSSNSLLSVDIPGTVTTIRINAFYLAGNLASVTLHEGLVQLDQGVFASTAISAIKIPNSVTQMGSYVFAGDANLTEVTLPPLLQTIGEGSFMQDTSLHVARFTGPAPVIGVNVFDSTASDFHIEFAFNYAANNYAGGFTVPTWAGYPTYALNNLLSNPDLTLQGNGALGSTLVANPGTWDSGSDLTYAWLRDGVPVDGASSNTYTISQADLETNIEAVLTVSKFGFVTITKSTSIEIPKGQLVASPPALSVSGAKASVGETLTAATFDWNFAANSSIQWLRNDVAIEGATGQSYTLSATDLGQNISCAVTGSLDHFDSKTVTSSSIKVVLGSLTIVPKPILAGRSKVGRTLSIKKNLWGQGVTLKYQWLRDGVKIAKANKPKYKLSKKDLGHKISVRIVSSQPGYFGVTRITKPTKKVVK